MNSNSSRSSADSALLLLLTLLLCITVAATVHAAELLSAAAAATTTTTDVDTAASQPVLQIIFSTDCSVYMAWQVELLMFSVWVHDIHQHANITQVTHAICRITAVTAVAATHTDTTISGTIALSLDSGTIQHESLCSILQHCAFTVSAVQLYIL